MQVFSYLSFKAKLALLMGLSALALIISTTLAATFLHTRMVDDRIDNLRAVVESAVGIAASLEKQVAANELTREQAFERFRVIAHSIRVDGGSGYIVAQDRGNRTVVHGTRPELEGKASPSRSSDGRNIADLTWETLRNADTGIITYDFPRPGATRPVPKIAYAAYFKPWDINFLVSAYTDDLDDAFRSVIWRLAGAGGVILALTLVVAWLVSLDITASLGRLKGAMGALARGDVTTDVPGLGRVDEVGEMAAAVQVFKDNAIEVQRLQRAQEAAEALAAEEKRRTLDRLADDFEAQVGTIAQVVAAATAALEQNAAAMRQVADQTRSQVADVVVASKEASGNVHSA
ncbi:MAG: cache domain-containing protein, partial [Proteobacteria bacterium]|nr:cache domain-containing protein [Pseudomonadota bacterium]